MLVTKRSMKCTWTNWIAEKCQQIHRKTDTKRLKLAIIALETRLICFLFHLHPHCLSTTWSIFPYIYSVRVVAFVYLICFCTQSLHHPHQMPGYTGIWTAYQDPAMKWKITLLNLLSIIECSSSKDNSLPDLEKGFGTKAALVNPRRCQNCFRRRLLYQQRSSYLMFHRSLLAFHPESIKI